MQIHRHGYGIRGFGRFAEYGLRFLAMVSEKAQYRHRVLLFWERHGLKATMEAFEINRRTLYHWRKQFRDGKQAIESLNEKSRAPRKRRKRLWPKAILDEIGRLRKAHPNLGKRSFIRF